MGTPAIDIRDRLGPPPELPDWPLVSIVVLNRDGVEHLRNLLAGLVEQTDYPNFELILVDNGSTDESLEFIRSVEAPFPISIVANAHNESFSDANNQGAELASGELLLFLNNDIEPFEAGWLRELVVCLRDSGAGAVGATLIYPDEDGGSSSRYWVQTRQIRLRGSSDSLAGDMDSTPRELFDESFGEDVDSAATIGSCLLVEREIFRQVGGFTRGYFYGGEDEDLSLKLRERGFSVIYSGRSIAIHHISSTSRELHGEAGGSTRRANSLLLRKRWGPRVWREYQLDRLAGGGLWAAPDQGAASNPPSREEVMALGFCLRSGPAAAVERDSLMELEAELATRGHRRLALGDNSIEDPRAYVYDVAVHLRGPARYVPEPGQLNVLWAVSHFDALSGIECKRYDVVMTSDAELAARLRPGADPTPVMVLADEQPASSLIDAVLTRAKQLDFPTRIAPQPAPEP